MSDRWNEVRELLGAAVGPVFPAAQLLVVDGGAAVLDEVAGDCTRETLFDLASLTKPLATTTLVMRLHDERRLALDEELRPDVTVRHALSHSGGLPWWRPFHERLAGAADPHRAVIEAARAEPLESPPGARSVYSDLGFLLLGDAVERAGAAPLDDQWRALRLGGATFHPEPDACAPTTGGLRGLVDDENARFMLPGGVAGHAGLFGTAASVSTIAAELVAAWRGARDRVAAPATVRLFWSPAGVPGSTWCLGWDRPSQAGYSSAGSLWSREGVGHTGFTGTSLWIEPGRSRWVVLLSNRVHPSRDNDAIRAFRPLLHDTIVRALDGPPGSSPR